MRTDNLPGRADSTCCKHHSLLFFLIGVELLSRVVLASAHQQGESAGQAHISPLFWISFPLRSPQSTEQSSLCCAGGPHQLPILCIVSTVYKCLPQSRKSSTTLPVSSLEFLCLGSLSLSLLLPWNQAHRYPFSINRFHTHKLYTVFVFQFQT